MIKSHTCCRLLTSPCKKNDKACDVCGERVSEREGERLTALRFIGHGTVTYIYTTVQSANVSHLTHHAYTVQRIANRAHRRDAHTERGRRAYRHVERTVTRLCKRTCKRTSLHKVDTYAYPSALSCAEGRAYRRVERTVTQTVQTCLISRRHVPIRAHRHAQRGEGRACRHIK